MICGKIIYHTRTQAAEAVTGTQKDRRRRRGHHGLNVIKETYYCKDCNGWHTSSGGKKTRRKKMRQAPPMTEFNYNARMIRVNRSKKSAITIRNFRKRF